MLNTISSCIPSQLSAFFDRPLKLCRKIKCNDWGKLTCFEASSLPREGWWSCCSWYRCWWWWGWWWWWRFWQVDEGASRSGGDGRLQFATICAVDGLCWGGGDSSSRSLCSSGDEFESSESFLFCDGSIREGFCFTLSVLFQAKGAHMNLQRLQENCRERVFSRRRASWWLDLFLLFFCPFERNRSVEKMDKRIRIMEKQISSSINSEIHGLTKKERRLLM